jgi:hypothetical protein
MEGQQTTRLKPNSSEKRNYQEKVIHTISRDLVGAGSHGVFLQLKRYLVTEPRVQIPYRIGEISTLPFSPPIRPLCRAGRRLRIMAH